MIKVLVIQTDNRDYVDYVGLSKLTNKRQVERLNQLQESKPSNPKIEFINQFVVLEPRFYQNINPATAKINVLQELLNNATEDYIVFLDTDAWIQTPEYLIQLILMLHDKTNVHGAYSRDPYLIENDYINSGSFILKIDDYNREMYKEIKADLDADPSRHHSWSYDQYYISKHIHRRKDDFLIFIPHILNTPDGIILRHSWWKNYKLFGDLYAVLDCHNNNTFKTPEWVDITSFLDNAPYPNPDDSGHRYRY